MGKRGLKWITVLLFELSIFGASSDDPRKFSFPNITMHQILLRNEMNNMEAGKERRERRRLHSNIVRSARGSYTMDSASKRFHTNIQSTMPTSPAGTLWRHSLLNKVFRHESSDSFLQTKTAVLNSGYHNSFGT